MDAGAAESGRAGQMRLEDRVLKALTDYLERMATEAISQEASMEVRRRIFDSLGVALGSLKVGNARGMLERFSSLDLGPGARLPPSSTLWGLGYALNPLDAVFANGFMVRYLDFNDTYLSREPLHPSDVIPAILTMSEAYGMPMEEAIAAIAIAYDVGMTLCDAGSLRRHGWDHVNYTGVAVASSLAWLFKESREQMANAISIFATSSLATRQTRVGELSHWKGAAAASSSRDAAFSVLLSSYGFTGPSSPFDGEMGFIRQLLSGEFNIEGLEMLSAKGSGSRILDSYIKPYPVEYHILTAVEAALRLRRRVADTEGIKSIEITTFSAANDIVVKDKWSPTNKETADHSMPYLIAYALARGEPWLEAYDQHAYSDRAIRRLMEVQTYRVTDEFDGLYPYSTPVEIEVRLKGGGVERERVDWGKGHPKNPLSNEELKSKFERLVTGLPIDVDMIYDALLKSRNVPDIGEVIPLLSVAGGRRGG